jgi:hypothetical protein
MYTLTIQTKFTFGDRVKFESDAQQQKGEGRVFAITVDAHRLIDYIIEIDKGAYHDLQPGILESEMTLLAD